MSRNVIDCRAGAWGLQCNPTRSCISKRPLALGSRHGLAATFPGLWRYLGRYKLTTPLRAWNVGEPPTEMAALATFVMFP